ncbi:FecR family protein [Mucilaginibacter jinjuensis]|uniref:FecR family protein n=1 Tax=Mucilaginibacter jinjuensis TaxID=1176721 RepID=A0ABY7TEC8_9SPHI|nr:FecR family protein [Mucilaginibacter jinjuensis]WCT14879.1 FecR family protein [Mucilaginibacter jinjuensis]
MIGKDEFITLYKKYLEGQCTPEEIKQLEAYEDDMSMPDDSWGNDLGDRKKLFNTLQHKLQESIGYEGGAHHTWYAGRWFSVAASVLILLSIGFGLWKVSENRVQQQPVYAMAQPSKKIVPGSDKAYLTMANGSVITLNGAANGTLAVQSGIKVDKVQEGLLKYTTDDNASSEQTAFNLITTPRGGKYQVELADGTRVWLNSATSLKYPASFTGKERRVELSGEAYFEVAKNPSKPFLVTVNGITVRVLGTHFNIMGYNDEKAVKTTLLEGSVKLSYNAHEVLLKPGEQGLLNTSQTGFEVSNVDVDDVVAWKNGFFAFNNEDIQTIMKRISRWYDVDVVFPEQFKRKNFGGTVSCFDDVSQVLKSLELTGSVHFKIEGRRIIVMP